MIRTIPTVTVETQRAVRLYTAYEALCVTMRMMERNNAEYLIDSDLHRPYKFLRYWRDCLKELNLYHSTQPMPVWLNNLLDMTIELEYYDPELCMAGLSLEWYEAWPSGHQKNTIHILNNLRKIVRMIASRYTSRSFDKYGVEHRTNPTYLKNLRKSRQHANKPRNIH